MIAIIGGTGRLGLGLARRLSRAQTPVLIGSRDETRARAAAAEAGLGAERGRTNIEAARSADLVVLTVPVEGHEPTLRALGPHLGGKVLLDTTVHYDRSSRSVLLPEGMSAAERAQRLVPKARLVSGFHTVSSTMLADLERPARGDVLFCGDDAGAKEPVAAMVASIGMRAVDAGSLSTSRVLEQLAGLLIDLNRRYKKKDLTFQVVGLE
ncbi:MAG: NADPH-dependent F420 reductase [bacterium]